ncbi:MAG: hypothetical protein ACJ74O_18215 [Frankiaceae bacterium]
MLAADQTLLRLADPAARDALLSSDGLLAIATTCYAIDTGTVVGDTTAVYDSLDLAVAISPNVAASARWSRSSDQVPVEGSASIVGLVAPSPGADAVWAGSVVVRTAGGAGTITVADVTDAGRDAGVRDHLGVGLTFSAPTTVTLSTPPLVLPVVVAFLVADADASPRTLLQQSEVARRAAARYPSATPPSGAPQRTQERCVCWLVPATAFDDEGWPGATTGSAQAKRDQRLAAARGWLSGQGIAVVTT